MWATSHMLVQQATKLRSFLRSLAGGRSARPFLHLAGGRHGGGPGFQGQGCWEAEEGEGITPLVPQAGQCTPMCFWKWPGLLQDPS
jgi:hypothetical protein